MGLEANQNVEIVSNPLDTSKTTNQSTQMNSTPNSALTNKFLAGKPTLLGVIEGAWVYEHPTQGEDGPLIAIVGGKKRVLSGTIEEVREAGITACSSLKIQFA